MEEYTRMLDKKKKPTTEAVDRYLGEESAERLRAFEAQLRSQYNLEKVLRFPFGNNYGWGYKLSHGRKHLCYAFFEDGAFTVTLQIGDEGVDAVEKSLSTFLPQTQALWADRYPCGERGGWMHYRVLSDDALPDIIALINIKIKPPKKTAS